MASVIKLGQYKNIEVSAELKEVTQEEVDLQVANILASNPMLVDKEGNVENGDTTIIDFEGIKDGVAFAGGTAQGYTLEIGSGSFIPGFEEQMIGMAKGETRALNLTFPENYGAAELAGADVIFNVTVHEIKTKKEAELTDEYVKSLGNPQIQTVDALKEYVRFQLTEQAKQERARVIEDKVLDILLENSEVEVEEADIAKNMIAQKKQLEQQVSMYGINLEQYIQISGMSMEMLEEQLRPSCISQAKYEAIIHEIIKVENLDATDEDAENYLQAMSAQTRQPKEELLKHIDMNLLKNEIKCLKANQIVMTTVVVK